LKTNKNLRRAERKRRQSINQPFHESYLACETQTCNRRYTKYIGGARARSARPPSRLGVHVLLYVWIRTGFWDL